MKSRSLFALVAIACALPMLACESNKIAVSSNFDPLANFPEEATYVWDTTSNRLPEDPRLQTAENDHLIRTAANEAFAARGYTPVREGLADYLLAYQFAAYNWTSPDKSSSIGTISFELVEANSGRRVWTGFGRAELFVGLTSEQSHARLLDAMSRMLANFPPPQIPKK